MAWAAFSRDAAPSTLQVTHGCTCPAVCMSVADCSSMAMRAVVIMLGDSVQRVMGVVAVAGCTGAGVPDAA